MIHIQPVDPGDLHASCPDSCPERGQDTGQGSESGGTPMGRGPNSNTPSSVQVDPWTVRPGPNRRNQ